jgi:hypothetical protein
MEQSPELRVHDRFNLVAIGLIVIMDIAYLLAATEWSKMGTDSLGDNHRAYSDALLLGFATYLVIDVGWVIWEPKCVASSPAAIIIHHVACLVMLCIPWLLPRFSWHMAANLLVEANTLFLTLRRNVAIGSTAHKVFDGLFYITWVALRLVFFPVMVVFFYHEYHRYSMAVGTYVNIVALAPPLEAFITAMGVKWTLDMALKLWKEHRGPKEMKRQYR